MIEQVLSWDNMCAAWQQVKANQGAPGVDEVTLKRWERNWETNLERLRRQVRTNTYCPNRPKRFVVAKKDGGERVLSRLTVTDKVIQRAALNVLDPVFEARFLSCSHGYRVRRSVATAIQQVLAWRDRGLGWVLDADIAACFDSLDHEVLTGLIRRGVNDWTVLNLMNLWLKAGKSKTPSSKSQNPKSQNPNPKSEIKNQKSVGVPMGAVLSPLWCNIYLHQLDARLTTAGWRLVRFADDFVALTATRAEAERALAATEAILQTLKLTLSPTKTRITSFDEGFKFLGVTFYRDTYSYTWEQKQIEVQGRNVRWLFKHTPIHY